MAIIVKFSTVVIRIKTIEAKYPGGMDAFMKDYSIRRDFNIVGLLFMSTGDQEEVIDKLESVGFSYIVNDEFVDIAAVDEYGGLFLPCSWLETSITTFPKREIKVSTCWLKGSADRDIGIRLGREYDPALWEETPFKE
jgi:hypothetical protein